MNTEKIRPALLAYLEGELLPRYDAFDAAHRRDHALAVAERSMNLAAHYDVDAEMVLTVAYYHDLGLCEGREHHHEVSAQLLLADEHLLQWFSKEQLAVMAEAVADHRASAAHAPRSIYGSIVAEADASLTPCSCCAARCNMAWPIIRTLSVSNTTSVSSTTCKRSMPKAAISACGCPSRPTQHRWPNCAAS